MKRPYYITWSAQDNAKTLAVRGVKNGCTLILEDGREVIDLYSTSIQTSFGYASEPIITAIEKQLRALPIAAPKFVFSLKEEVTTRLLHLLNLGGGKIFYTVSGAEAVENALKIVRQITGRKKIVARTRSYHGASLGALSITGDWRNQGHFNVSEFTVRIPEPQEDPDASQALAIIESSDPETIAAFCLETITAANGVIAPPPSWWSGIQKISEKHKIFIIADEVACGFGRTGKPFGFHHYSFKPDFVCMSKAISGGYVPFGALWTSDAVAKVYDQRILSCGLTHYAHPLGLAALGAVLDILENPSFWRELEMSKKVFHEKLTLIASRPYVREVRKIGFFGAIDLKDRNFKDCLDDWVQAGVLLLQKGPDLVLAPPLIMEATALGSAMDRVIGLLDGKARA